MIKSKNEFFSQNSDGSDLEKIKAGSQFSKFQNLR